MDELIAIINASDETASKTKETLKNNDILAAELVEELAKGKEVVDFSAADVQKTAEESGSLLQAFGIIQNIAGQTNLLTMNAAIEVVHAGESGNGLAGQSVFVSEPSVLAAGGSDDSS